MANENVTHPDRIEKFKRDLAQLRSRALRIQSEADSAIRDVAAIASEFDALTKAVEK